MDVAVLLLLPLVGGYAFARYCNVSRYLVAREEGHKLYFRAAFWGFSLFMMAWLIRLWISSECDWYRAFESAAKSQLSPFLREPEKGSPFELTVVAVGALVLGAPLGKALNLFFWKGRWLAKAIEHDYLEVLLNRAATETRPIAVTLKGRKVYVGFVLETLDPVRDRKWITVMPLVSGYRDPETLRLVFVTNYRDVYGTKDPVTGSRLPKPLDHLTSTDFEITLPVDEIQTVSFFDLVAYRTFNTGTPMPKGKGKKSGKP